MKRLSLILVLLVLILPLTAQESGGSGSGFSAGIGLGSDLLPDPDDSTKLTSWSKLGFQPDVAFGKFGIGLDLMFRFQLYPDESSSPIRIYSPDWIPQGDQTILDVYLPKIMYVRYGLRGIDPFYVKLGSISDFTLGNGLIVSDYANTRFLPDLRIFGLQVGLDGALLKFPFAGFEALTGNLARLDVVGGRIYVRPLVFMGDSLPGRLQAGVTATVDTNPFLYSTSGTGEPIFVVGADLTLPIVTGQMFSLTAFAEGAREMNESIGAITGVSGRLLKFLRYTAQLRALQEGFIPSYFDTNYDFYRAERYTFIDTNPAGDFQLGWLGMLGFSLLGDKLVFSTLLDGPFSDKPAVDSDNSSLYPHLKGSFLLKEGMIGGISLEAVYEKYFLGKTGTFFEDLIDPVDAAIGMKVNYKTGATVLTLDYAYRYDPSMNGGAGGFDVSSSLSASVRF
ncbi:MAG: hypothetical protein CVV53_06595 [Spirochaetae bacterium HGW-Spirochaetae-9]|nr:MAG: hypothetical protein CVV53_06595 [Spirochaetae bacterium HGW-Spirochaetae-9]